MRAYTFGMGLKIKQMRVTRGWSQEHLAELARVSRSQLSEIENEKKPANTLRLAAIANAFGVGVEELFEDSSEAYRAVILGLMRDMTPEDRDALISHARFLAGAPKG